MQSLKLLRMQIPTGGRRDTRRYQFIDRNAGVIWRDKMILGEILLLVGVILSSVGNDTGILMHGIQVL